MKDIEEIKKENKQFCEKYLKCWTSAMLADDKELLRSWTSSYRWTKYNMEKVLDKLATALSPKYDEYGKTKSREYYRVDFSLYSWFGQSVWTLDYAIEHENERFEIKDYSLLDESGKIKLDGNIKSKGWFDEFAKLLPLKCARSRVIIGYDDFEHIDEKLKICHSLLNNKQIKGSLTNSPILLILFPSIKHIKEIVQGWNDTTHVINDNDLIRFVLFYKSDESWKIEPSTQFTDSELQLDHFDTPIVTNLKKVYSLISELK